MPECVARRRRAVPTLAALAVLTLCAACDSGDPLDAPTCGQVAGTYDFAAYVFDPDADFFEPISLLDTLDTSETQLRLLNGCQVVLTYAFRGGLTTLATGTFDVSADEIQLSFGEDDAAKLNPLYLSSPVTFRRLSATTLVATQTQTVDLTTISPEFEGVPPVRGTILVNAVLR